ncbi:hypothetical protein HMSSN036_55190 [Paenibacillus macerans]|nr:hypothetical protein HMSSN036_55190 [Paenibacillus macerans]
MTTFINKVIKIAKGVIEGIDGIIKEVKPYTTQQQTKTSRKWIYLATTISLREKGAAHSKALTFGYFSSIIATYCPNINSAK